MGETLILRRRVLEEALRGVKSFSKGRTPPSMLMTKDLEFEIFNKYFKHLLVM